MTAEEKIAALDVSIVPSMVVAFGVTLAYDLWLEGRRRPGPIHPIVVMILSYVLSMIIFTAAQVIL